MILENTEINEVILQRFQRLQNKDRLAHAYLFVGPQGAGKYATAIAVAKLLNCEAPSDDQESLFCGTCLNCKKIDSGNHPDIHFLETEDGGPLKIEHARTLLNHMKMKPFSAPRKIFIIKDIENLTKEAANAILKSLEEPTPNSLLILTTSVIEKNLDTVRSRCHAMHFITSAKTKLADRLTKYYDGNSADAHFLAYFSEGCMGKAKYLKDKGLLAKKDEVIDHFIFSQADDRYTKKILQDKESTRQFLDVLLSWIRDSLLMKVGVSEFNLIHRDRIRDLKKFQSKYTFEELCDLNKEVIQMSRLLSENLNIKIPLMIIKEKLVYG